MRTVREMPVGAREFWLRMIVVPFEIAMALTAIWSGLAGLFSLSVTSQAFNTTLPHSLSTGFNVLYVVSGFAVTTGVGWDYRNLEGFGLTLLLSGLIVRAAALYLILGTNSITTNVLIQALFFGGACAIKIILLLQKKHTIIVALDKDVVEILPVGEVTHGPS